MEMANVFAMRWHVFLDRIVSNFEFEALNVATILFVSSSTTYMHGQTLTKRRTQVHATKHIQYYGTMLLRRANQEIPTSVSFKTIYLVQICLRIQKMSFFCRTNIRNSKILV